MREPNLSLYKPYYSYILERFRNKAQADTAFADIVAVTHPRYLESLALLGARGCDSREIQGILVNGFKFGLGQEPVDLSEPYPLATADIYDTGAPVIDYYCKFDGRKDPACAKLIGFLFGRPTPSCFDGLQIPAAPKPPQVMVCRYVMVINEDTGWKSDRRYTYWHKHVPDNLNDLLVYGVDQFSSVAPVAVTACPPDSRAADKLSGNRHGVAIGSYEGGMPAPRPSLTVDRCEHEDYEPPSDEPKVFAEGDYAVIRRVAPKFPPSALSRGLEGYVDVEFTVTATGTAKDVVVVASSDVIFDQAAINTMMKYKYKPRVVDGQALEVTGVTERVYFRRAINRRGRRIPPGTVDAPEPPPPQGVRHRFPGQSGLA